MTRKQFSATFLRTRGYYYANLSDPDKVLAKDQKVVIVRVDRAQKILRMLPGVDDYKYVPEALTRAYVKKLVRTPELVELVIEALRPIHGRVSERKSTYIKITAPLSLGTESEQKVDTLVFPTWSDFMEFADELAFCVWCYVLAKAGKYREIAQNMFRFRT